MKTLNLIKIIPVALMGLILSVNAGAANLHECNPVNPAMPAQMECWMFNTGYLSVAAATVEAWMLDDSWLDQENGESVIESWMNDSNYLVNETQAVETWMLDSNYLVEETTAVESWMLEGSYLADEASAVESWMLDSGYMENYSDNVN